MSNILFRDAVREGNSVVAEAYSVQNINVFKNGEDEPLDIKGLVQRISIIEDIDKPFIEVNLLIIDASNRLEALRLNGNEKVEINIERGDPDVGDFSFHTLDDLRIAEISGLTQQDVKNRGYSIRCISDWMYINASKALVRPFEGTIGKVVDEICRTDLGLGNRDEIYISESSKGIVNGVFTHQRPIQAINWLMRNAFEDKSPFFFFATTGFSSTPNRLNFVSLKELIDDVEEAIEPKIIGSCADGPSLKNPTTQLPSIKPCGVFPIPDVPLSVAGIITVAQGNLSVGNIPISSV